MMEGPTIHIIGAQKKKGAEAIFENFPKLSKISNHIF